MTNKRHAQWFKWATIIKRYSRSKCMQCSKSPQIDAHWADGRGRAWFCIDHFLEWTKEEPREIVRAWFIKDGEVPKTLKDHPGIQLLNLKQGRADPGKIAKQARKLAKGTTHGR